MKALGLELALALLGLCAIGSGQGEPARNELPVFAIPDGDYRIEFRAESWRPTPEEVDDSIDYIVSTAAFDPMGRISPIANRAITESELGDRSAACRLRLSAGRWAWKAVFVNRGETEPVVEINASDRRGRWSGINRVGKSPFSLNLKDTSSSVNVVPGLYGEVVRTRRLLERYCEFLPADLGDPGQEEALKYTFPVFASPRPRPLYEEGDISLFPADSRRLGLTVAYRLVAEPDDGTWAASTRCLDHNGEVYFEVTIEGAEEVGGVTKLVRSYFLPGVGKEVTRYTYEIVSREPVDPGELESFAPPPLAFVHDRRQGDTVTYQVDAHGNLPSEGEIDELRRYGRILK